MSNGNIETRLSALEAQMQELRDLLTQTAQIANSNAKAIQANSHSISELQETAQASAQATLNLRGSIESLRDTMQVSFMDVLGLHREIAIQQQQNTNDIRDLRTIVQDWLTQDRGDV